MDDIHFFSHYVGSHNGQSHAIPTSTVMGFFSTSHGLKELAKNFVPNKSEINSKELNTLEFSKKE